MKVRDVMSSPVHTAPASATLGEVARLMLGHGIGAVPIVDADGLFAGMVTDLDFGPVNRPVPFSNTWHTAAFHEWLADGRPERVYRAAARAAAREVAGGRDVPTLGEDDSLDRVIELFLDHHVHAIPVLRERRPVGIITRHDLIRVMVPGAAEPSHAPAQASRRVGRPGPHPAFR